MTVEFGAVPGGNAPFLVSLAGCERSVAFAAHDVGGRIAVTAFRFDTRDGILDRRYVNRLIGRAVLCL